MYANSSKMPMTLRVYLTKPAHKKIKPQQH